MKDCCALLAITAATAAAVASESALFLDASRAWLPKQAIVITEEAAGASAGMMRAGFDPATGAWFLVTTGNVGGRDPNGQAYYMEIGETELRRPKYRPLPYFIGTVVPGTILASIHEAPDILLGAEQRGSSWFATYNLELDITKSPASSMIYIAEFDAQTGRLRSIEREHPTDRQRIEFDHCSPQFDRRIYPKSSARYRYTIDHPASPDSFTHKSVVPQMQELKISVDQRFAAIVAGFRENEDGQMVASAKAQNPVAYAESRLRKLQYPLLIGGAVLIAFAGIMHMRRRTV